MVPFCWIRKIDKFNDSFQRAFSLDIRISKLYDSHSNIFFLEFGFHTQFAVPIKSLCHFSMSCLKSNSDLNGFFLPPVGPHAIFLKTENSNSEKNVAISASNTFVANTTTFTVISKFRNSFALFVSIWLSRICVFFEMTWSHLFER